MKKTAGNRKRIFISSVQKELQPERKAIKDFVENDPLLRRFFDVFLFENLPACEGRADEVYLEEVGRCDVYVGILANEYGSRQHSVLAPAEYELPKDAVTEAIVNAVAHRDYTSNARTSSRCACFISFTQPSRFARQCLVNWDSLYGNRFASGSSGTSIKV